MLIVCCQTSLLAPFRGQSAGRMGTPVGCRQHAKLTDLRHQPRGHVGLLGWTQAGAPIEAASPLRHGLHSAEDYAASSTSSSE